MNAKGLAHCTLSAMSDGLSASRGSIMPALTLIERLKKLLFEFNLLYVHISRIEKAGEKWKLFFTFY